MSTFTNALSAASETKLINWMSGTAFPAAPASLEVALFTGDPGDAFASPPEVTGGSYTRQAITLTAPQTSEADGSVTENAAPVTFSGMPTVTVTHWAIYEVGGDPIVYGPLAVPVTTGAGGAITFAENTFRLEMGGFTSQYLGEAFINWARGTAFPAQPASVLLGLSTSDPKRDGASLSEPAGGSGYARQAVVFGAPAPAVGGGQEIRSTNAVIFGPSTGTPWGTVTHAALFDDAGNQLGQGALSAPVYIQAGEGLSIASNGFGVVLA